MHAISDDPVLRALEATALGADITPTHTELLLDRAITFGLAGICVPLVDLMHLDRKGGIPDGLDKVTVANFPHGDLPGPEALHVASRSLASGADIVDLVFRRDRILAGDLPRRPAGQAIRVIFEVTAYRSEAEMMQAASILVGRGYKDLKTSTGYHPSQSCPAVEAVGLLRKHFGGAVTLKASGKIRTRAQAEALLEAGADRLGASTIRALAPDGPA